MDWKDLNDEEKKAIRDSRDVPIIAVIKGLACEDRKLIYDSIKIKSEYEPDYNESQRPWISDFKGYWKENNHKDPEVCSEEFSADFIKSHEYERFKLYYAAKHPERVEIKHINRRTLDFFAEIEDFLRIENLILSTTK